MCGRLGEDAALVHRVQDAAMDGLQAVAHVRQGARDDDAHRVLDERLAHLVARTRRSAGCRRARRVSPVAAAAGIVHLLLELAVVVIAAPRPALGSSASETSSPDRRPAARSSRLLEVLGKCLGAPCCLVVSHVMPFSCVCWRDGTLPLLKMRGREPVLITRPGSARRGRGARCTRGGTPPGCP